MTELDSKIEAPLHPGDSDTGHAPGFHNRKTQLFYRPEVRGKRPSRRISLPTFSPGLLDFKILRMKDKQVPDE